MELAKVTSKGQITIPLMIRNLLQLKTGDKVFFEESEGKVYITNAAQITLSNVQTQMQGEAKKAGFQTEDDVKIDKPLIFTPSRYYELIDNKA